VITHDDNLQGKKQDNEQLAAKLGQHLK